jgi:hypothetical protein
MIEALVGLAGFGAGLLTMTVILFVGHRANTYRQDRRVGHGQR